MEARRYFGKAEVVAGAVINDGENVYTLRITSRVAWR